MARVRVLYEDKLLGGNPTELGPHKLVVRYVCDRLGKNPWELKDLIGDPKAATATSCAPARRISASS